LRAAILIALADQPDVQFDHRRVVDRWGRPGVEFTMHTGDEAVILVFDPVSGQLNAMEQRAGGTLFSYHLIDAPRWSRGIGPENPQPTPASTLAPTALPGGKFSVKPAR
jgi:hypothetical protein